MNRVSVTSYYIDTMEPDFVVKKLIEEDNYIRACILVVGSSF